jgi:GNAT superfamily N-acetyltransferase
MARGETAVPAQAGTGHDGLAVSPSPSVGEGRGEGATRPASGRVTIRLARDEADIAAMIEMGRALHTESRFRVYPYDEARLRQAGHLALTKGNPGAIMAELNGAPIGMAVVVAGEHFFSAAKTATAQLLYVAPDHRGSRAAILLLKALRRWAHEAGVADLHVNNTTAIDAARTDRFLRKMGFRQTGRNYVLEGV